MNWLIDSILGVWEGDRKSFLSNGVGCSKVLDY